MENAWKGLKTEIFNSFHLFNVFIFIKYCFIIVCYKNILVYIVTITILL